MDVLLIYGVVSPFISHFRWQWHLRLHCVLACCLLSLSMSPGPTRGTKITHQPRLICFYLLKLNYRI